MLTSSSRTKTQNLTQTAGAPPAIADESHAAALAAEVSILRDSAIVLTPGRWAIGSADWNQIVVPDDSVAARHAMIIVTEHRVVMTTWSEATYVNGRRCCESLLCPGDILTVGTIDIAIRSASGPELIAQLPEVSSDETTSDTLPAATTDDIQRRLQDLDTALGLLADELESEAESEDALNELVDSIQRDLENRSQHVQSDPELSGKMSSSSDENVATSEPATAGPLSLDVVLSEVEAAADNAAEQAVGFESSIDNETPTDQAEEFAELVGSTSILAQNMTLNALRSRADAIRQLDALVIAATGAEDVTDTTETSSGTTASWSSPEPTHAAAHLQPDPEPEDNTPSEDNSPSTSSVVESEPVDPDEPATDSLTAINAATETTVRTESVTKSEPDSESGESASSTWEAASAPASDSVWNDEDVNQPATELTDEPIVDASVPTEAASGWDDVFATQPELETEPTIEDSDGDASCDDAGRETVELAATETVNNTGSLLSSLFHTEARNGQNSDTREDRDEIESAPETPDSVAESTSSFFDTPTAASRKPFAKTESDSAGDVRSRLAEMFDIPSLTSHSEASESAATVTPSETLNVPDSVAPVPATQPQNFTEEPTPAEPRNVSTWLDSIKPEVASQSAATTAPSPGTDSVSNATLPAASEPSPGFTLEASSSAPTASISDDTSAPTTSRPADNGDSVPDAADENADPVAAYMRDLIARNRVRHGKPEDESAYLVHSENPRPAEAESDASETISSTEETTSARPLDTSVDEPEANWLTQQPKHQVNKDQLRADVQTLREVANQTARSAVSRATRKQLKLEVIVKAAASVIMLGSGVAASVLGVSQIFAFGVMGIGVYFAADLGLTIARNWKAVKN
ncbi:MAG: FHA domain-containing protein [Planctomycetota bacterium]|jgi:hypothetical protein